MSNEQEKSNQKRQCKEFNVVINVPNGMSLDTFNNSLIRANELLTSCGYMYAAMIHDKDVNDRGELKTYHVHYVIWSSKRCRIETMLYRLLDYLHFEPYQIFCIQIDKCNELAFSIQYLTHKNHPNKYQYAYSDIMFNCGDKVLNDYYNSDLTIEITTRQLVQWVVYDKLCNVELMFKLGIARYHYYKNQIDEIRQTYFRADAEKLLYLKSIEKQYTSEND